MAAAQSRRSNLLMLASIGLLTGGAIVRVAIPEAWWRRGPVRIGGIPAPATNKADRTLFIVLREGCRYCTASMPFYRELLARGERSRAGAARLVAVVIGTSDVARARAYAATHRLAVPEVIALSGKAQDELGVTGTPTLLLTDRPGNVRGSWVGKLDQDGERVVVDALFGQ